MITDGAAPDPMYLEAKAKILTDEALDPAFRALVMSQPTQEELAQMLFDAGHTPDPEAIFNATQTLAQASAERLKQDLPRIYDAHQVKGPYSPDAGPSGRRVLANSALWLLSCLDGCKQAQAQYDAADNMTQQISALGCLQYFGHGADATQAFYDQWQHDRLVIDKWFAMQVSNTRPDQTVATAQALTEHADFDMKNPNRFRAVFGALAWHHAGFHRADGAGYRLLADWLIKLDPVNPQTTARIITAFQSWRRYDTGRQALMRAELERIMSTPDLSGDTGEMVGRILEG